MKLEELRRYKQQILQISAEHGVDNVHVFGSVARGEENIKSDIDFLVTIEKPMGWHFFDLWPSLENLLGCDVDLMTDDAIRPRLRNKILTDAVPL